MTRQNIVQTVLHKAILLLLHGMEFSFESFVKVTRETGKTIGKVTDCRERSGGWVIVAGGADAEEIQNGIVSACAMALHRIRGGKDGGTPSAFDTDQAAKVVSSVIAETGIEAFTRAAEILIAEAGKPGSQPFVKYEIRNADEAFTFRMIASDETGISAMYAFASRVGAKVINLTEKENAEKAEKRKEMGAKLQARAEKAATALKKYQEKEPANVPVPAQAEAAA